jgi:hypothetical protein
MPTKVGARRTRHVRHQRHHFRAAGHEAVHGLAHARVIQRHHGDAVIAVDRVQRGRQFGGVENIGVADVGLDALGGEVAGVGGDFVLEAPHEDVVAFRQDEAEAVFAAAGETRRQAVRDGS